MPGVSLTLISDFNIEPLGRYLANAPLFGGKGITIAPFGQVYQTLVRAPSDNQWGSFIWTSPENTIPSFASAFAQENVSHSDVLADVDQFAEAVAAHGNERYVFVATWTLPPDYPGYGMLDWRPGLGVRHLLATMNVRLASRLSGHSQIFLLDAERWMHGPQVLSPKMWYATKVPYAPQVFEKAAADLLASIESIRGNARRLVVLDLDNTIWSGVVGETGWEGIRLGGHDHIGEAFRDFQRELKSLVNRGVQLAVVSKNDETAALEAIDRHPEMLLRRDDFAGWRINWRDKAENIASLVDELNLGLSSVVFIDDNPAERDRVSKAFPEVVVPDWPADPSAFVSALRRLNCFSPATFSDEDRGRRAMYVADRSRREARQEVGSAEGWLHRLSTQLRVARVDAGNIARVAQLFNKTNQLNLSTRRLSEQQIIAWAQSTGHVMLAISATDCFGDLGLIGVIGLEVQGGGGRLTDFVLSCRAMGRKIEETLIHLGLAELAKLGAASMQVRFVPTQRNRPTLDVFKNAGLKQCEPHLFVVSVADGFPKPEGITMTFDEAVV